MKTNYACKQIWRLMIPDTAVGIGEVFFDFFNGSAAFANAGNRIVISAVKVMVAADVDVTSVLGTLLHLHKTSAVGTGGTAATLQGNSHTAATFSTVTPAPGALPDGITARITPTGGATAGAWLAQACVSTAETFDSTYIEKCLHDSRQEPISLGQGEGLTVIQGNVNTAGSVGFMVEFGILES
jgi:hypothetical protein